MNEVSLRTLVYFARNPEEELTSDDIRTKFGYVRRSYESVKMLRKMGLIEPKLQCGDGVRIQYTWRAGPTLLNIIKERT